MLVGLGVGVETGVGVKVGVGTGVAVGAGVGVDVGTGVNVAVAVMVWVGVGVSVGTKKVLTARCGPSRSKVVKPHNQPALESTIRKISQTNNTRSNNDLWGHGFNSLFTNTPITCDYKRWQA